MKPSRSKNPPGPKPSGMFDRLRSSQRSQAAACMAVALPLFTYFSCQNSKSSDPKIIGGFEVNDTTTFGPLQESTVAITDGFSLFRGRSFCSGTLIGKNTVLTAAHCFTDDEGRQTKGLYYVYFGNKVGKDGTMNARQIVAIERHPNYDHALTVSPLRQVRNAFDIALVKFSGEAPEGYKAAKLATAQNDLPSSLVLAGYGTTGTLLKNGSGGFIRGREGEPLSASDTGTLRAVQVALARTFETGAVFFVTSPDGSVKGACPGDSGGPAYFKTGEQWFVGGALSTGLTGFVDLNGDGEVDANCKGQNFYTDVRAHSQWISASMEKFGDGGQSNDPSPQPKPEDPKTQPIDPGTTEPNPETTPRPSTKTGKVYWVTNTLNSQFLARNEAIKLHYFNDTTAELTDCSAIAVVDSERPFRIWLLRLKDTFKTSTVSRLSPGNLAELSFSLAEIAEWQSRTYTKVSATLMCDGKVVPTQAIKTQSLGDLGEVVAK